jgi:hypothetical protein
MDFEKKITLLKESIKGNRESIKKAKKLIKFIRILKNQH